MSSITPDRPRSTTGPVLPEVQMHLHAPGSPGTGVVVASDRCTKGGSKSASFVRHVAIDVSNTKLAGAFRAGQSFGVVPPGLDARGQPHKIRLYSIASPTSGEDGSGRVLATTVKRTIDEHWETHKLFLGVASNYLCDLQVGETVQVTGPSGKRFLLPTQTGEHDYVFIATGTGIAPFRGMAMELFPTGLGARSASSSQGTGQAGGPSRAALVMGSPFTTDLLYDDLFRRMESDHREFRYFTAISREGGAMGTPPRHVGDELAAQGDYFRELLRSPRTLVYLCGIAGMELGVFRAIHALLGSDAEAYLEIDPEVAGKPEAWERRMIHKSIRPTRRIFMEVY
ncbi:MAG: hypothetical protein SFZ23_12990 [Planctomycetota bacterium]|nr:hypothetical protein [Planctomycetota bacterium]